MRHDLRLVDGVMFELRGDGNWHTQGGAMVKTHGDDRFTYTVPNDPFSMVYHSFVLAARRAMSYRKRK
jgi:hypothetical protein